MTQSLAGTELSFFWTRNNSRGMNREKLFVSTVSLQQETMYSSARLAQDTNQLITLYFCLMRSSVAILKAGCWESTAQNVNIRSRQELEYVCERERE